MTLEEQLERWVAGDPQCPNDAGNCCPDFSCCKHSLLAALPDRRRYKAGSKKRREEMEYAFLHVALANAERAAYVATGGGRRR